MNDQQDPFLRTLFAEQQQELTDDDFTESVVSLAGAHGRRVLFGRLAIAALIVLLELLLDSPLQHSLGAISDNMGATLYRIENEWLAFVLTPVNSVAGLLGIIFAGVLFAHRKLFH